MKGSESGNQFDGEIPRDIDANERQYVATTFSSFVDDTLLRNIDKVDTLGVDLTGDGVRTRESALRLRGEDATNITITDSPDGEDFQKEIYEQESVNGTGGDAKAYRLGRDGVVRRRDLPRQTPEQKDMDWAAGVRGSLPPRTPERDVTEALHGLREALAAEQESDALERQLGLKDRPIGTDELDALMRRVNAAKVLGRQEY